MIKVLIVLVCVYFVRSQLVLPQPAYDYPPQPTPYQFSYTAPAIGGSSSHQETGDGTGRVTGSYTVEDEDGRSRTVEYVADEYGFRANVVTNEPGTSNQAPADVTISSSAEEAYGGIQTVGSPVAGYRPPGILPIY